MTPARTTLLAIALAALAALAGCGRKDAAAPAKAAGRAESAVPECPTSIVAGGDPFESDGFEGKPVARTCLVGGTESSRQLAGRVSLLKSGETFTADRARADLDGLMKLGVFDDAAVLGLTAAQGASVVVLYVVRDRPRVLDLAFQGAKVFGDAELTAKHSAMKGSVFEPLRVNAIAQAVREEYLARGYEDCRVVLVTEPVPASGAGPDEVRLYIKVDEGRLWRLSKLELRGAKALKDAELRKAAALTVGQPFVKEEVERASLLVSAAYYDRGFVAMHIVPEQTGPDAQGNVALSFVIDEGDPYAIRALHVTKLGAPHEKEILEKVIHARPRQVFSRAALVEDLARIKEFFEKRGQAVDVEPVTALDPKTKTIALDLVVEPR